jgi:hypothetical protein
MYEKIMGAGFSDWQQFGWSVVLANLKTYQAACVAPKRVIATWAGVTGVNEFKLMRLALCATLMTDAYAHILNSSYSSEYPTWYDEYDAELGDPIDAVPSAPLTANVWGRKYANGYVLVNVGSSQVTDPLNSTTYTGLPAGVYKRLTGTQDPTVNSGATVTGAGVAIPSWDGRVLLCVTPGVHS